MLSVKDQLRKLVDDLDDERAAEALTYLSDLANDPDGNERLMTSNHERRASPPVVPGWIFQRMPAMDWQTLTAQQGVRPITDLDQLHGDFWPDDETADEFIDAVRTWRREGGLA